MMSARASGWKDVDAAWMSVHMRRRRLSAPTEGADAAHGAQAEIERAYSAAPSRECVAHTESLGQHAAGVSTQTHCFGPVQGRGLQ